jgi:hypothetical protein
LALRVVVVPGGRTADEWATLSREGARKATSRERTYLGNFFDSHPFRGADIAASLCTRGALLQEVFESKEMQTLHVAAVDDVMRKMEAEDLGISFALFLYATPPPLVALI